MTEAEIFARLASEPDVAISTAQAWWLIAAIVLLIIAVLLKVGDDL